MNVTNLEAVKQGDGNERPIFKAFINEICAAVAKDETEIKEKKKKIESLKAEIVTLKNKIDDAVFNPDRLFNAQLMMYKAACTELAADCNPGAEKILESMRQMRCAIC